MNPQFPRFAGQCLALLFLLLATAAQAAQPIGILDQALLTADGVSGWAYDPDVVSQSINIHFYIDGPAGSGTFIGSTAANNPSPGVNATLGITGSHRFTWTVPPQYTGRKIYAHAIDATGDGNPYFPAQGMVVGAGFVYSAQDTWAQNRLGVGITSLSQIPAGFKLAVQGKAIAEEVQVALAGNWPDYVFAPAYHLRPLSEVGQYVRQQHHLPGVPTAAQVQQEGIALGAMNAKLLEKVEELTLYLLAEKQAKDQLAEDVKLLRADVEKLKQSGQR